MNFDNLEEFEKETRKLVAKTYTTLDAERQEQLENEFLALRLNKEYLERYKYLYEQKKVSNTNRNGLIIPFVLGLTKLDPIANKKIPMQWVQEGDSPDIDSDCEDRDRVLEILIENFENDGRKRVAPISNFNAVTVKSGIKDAARFHEVPFQDVNLVTKAIPDKIEDEEGNEIESKLATIELVEMRVPEVAEFFKKFPKVKGDVELIKGQYRAISRHAGGVVIADDIDAIAPLTYSRGIIQTGFTDGIASRVGADMGFIKFDLLGLGTLRIISDCIHDIIHYHKEKWLSEVEEWTGESVFILNEDGEKISPFDYTSSEFRNIASTNELKHRFKFVRAFYKNVLHPSKIELDDQHVYQSVYQEGRFVGVFQMESEGMRRCAQSFVPNCIQDIFAAVAIYRPGPLAADVDKLYAEYKKKAESGNIQSEHPIIDKVLEKSYGLLIYQEQLMELATKLGGLSQKDVQKFRKVVSKKAVEKEKVFIDKIYAQFLDGCEKNNYSQEKGEELWRKMIAFGEYAFNLAHSASYGIVSYQTAWLLTYYKNEWYTAVLNNCKKDDLARNILEITADNVEISPPDILTSKTNWTYVPEDGSIKFGLSDVKGVGEKAALTIIQARKKQPFDPNDVFSFFQNEHISWRHCNRSKVSALIKAGAFDRYEHQILSKFEKWSVFDATIKEHRDIFKEWGEQGVEALKEKRLNYIEWKKRKELWDRYIEEGGDKNNKDLKPGRRVSKTEVFWDLPEWNKKQRVNDFIELLNFVPLSDNIKEFMSHVEGMGVKPIEEHLRHNKTIQPVWFRVMAIDKKKTKNGKEFYVIKGMGKESIEDIKCWTPETFTADISDFAVAYLEYDNKWGFSTARKRDIFAYPSL